MFLNAAFRELLPIQFEQAFQPVNQGTGQFVGIRYRHGAGIIARDIMTDTNCR